MTHTDQPILDVPYHPTHSIGLASAEDRITDRYHCSGFRGDAVLGLHRAQVRQRPQRLVRARGSFGLPDSPPVTYSADFLANSQCILPAGSMSPSWADSVFSEVVWQSQIEG